MNMHVREDMPPTFPYFTSTNFAFTPTHLSGCKG